MFSSITGKNALLLSCDSRLYSHICSLARPILTLLFTFARIDATNTHFEMCEIFEEVLRKRVNNVQVTQEWPLRTDDTKDRTLVISVGGDGTYLRTSSMIESSSVPLLGINTDPGRSLGILCGKFLYKHRSKESHIHKIFDQIEQKQFQWMYRQRINCKITQSIYDEESHYDGEHVTILKEQEQRITNKLLLNEMFMAEKDASKTSTYRIEADGEDIGRFKSSGVIISTGTGSSGWLYGARRVTTKNISEISKALLEKEDQGEPFDEHVKDQLLHALSDPEYTESLA